MTYQLNETPGAQPVNKGAKKMNTKNHLFEVLQTLVGKKVTFFTTNDFGFPISVKCELKSAYLQDYAQYKSLPTFVYRPKGKRTDYVKRIKDYNQILIFAGHVDLNADMFTSSKEVGGVTFRQSDLAFSSSYFTRALASTDQKPVFQSIRN